MNSKTWLLLLVALLCGGAAAMCVKSIFFVEANEADEAVVASGPKSQMLVANVDLPSGSELTAQNVRLTLAPERDVPREAISSFSDVAGSRTTRDLKAGEPISLFDLAVWEEKAEADSTFVKPGCVVVPIEIQTATKTGGSRDFLRTTALEKMLKSGDVVDLAVVKEEESGSASAFAASTSSRRRLTTETIVEGVDVVGVSDESRFSRETGEVERLSTVRVQLSEEQLATVRRAAEIGRVKVVPRAESNGIGAGTSDASFSGVPFEPPMNDGFRFDGLNVGNEEAPAAVEDDSDTLIVPVDEETAAPSEEAEGDRGAAKGIAPTAPLQASVVETRVAEEALVPAPTPEKKFKYVSPFVTVGK